MMARVCSVPDRCRGAFAAAMMVFAWTLSGCGGERLAVLEASPEGDLDALPTSLHIQFDHPIVDPQHPGAALRDLRLTLDPEIQGDIEFPTPASLRFTFAAPLIPARTYEVRIDSGLRAVDGRAVLRAAYRFAFRTPVNRVVAASVLPPERGEPSLPTRRELRHLDVHDRLRLDLAYPARTDEIERLLTVRAEPPGGGSEPVAASLQFAGTERTDWVIVAPATTWPLHTQIVITLNPGLHVAAADAGSETPDEPQVLRASTYGPFAVVGGPECRGCRPPPSLVVEFATPVDCAAALPFVRTAPRHELRCVEPPTDTAIRLVPDPPLLPFTTYTLRLRPGLADRFGQTLGQALEMPFETGDPKPRYRSESLFGLVARGGDPVHVETVYEGGTLEVSGTRLGFPEAWRVLEKAGLARGLADGDAARTDLSCEEAGEERCAESYERLPGELDTVLQLPQATITTIELPAPTEGEWRPVRIPLEPYLDGGGLVVLALRLLDAQGKQLGAPVLRLVSVTGLGITVRHSPAELMILVTRLADARPVEGVEVAVWPIDATGALGTPVGTAATGEDGIAFFAAERLVSADTSASLAARAFAITARSDDDTTLLVVNADARSALAPGRTLAGTVYTDRGLYEPGEEIHVRAVARLVGSQGPRPPAGRELLLRLCPAAARSSALATGSILLGPFGTGTATLTLPGWAPAGPYVLGAGLGDESLETTLVVGARRPTPLRLQLSADASRYRPGETLRATLHASYTFGSRPSGLPVRWTVRERRPAFVSRRFPAARFGADEQGRVRAAAVMASGTGTLDPDGVLRFSIPVRAQDEPSPDGGGPYDLLLSAEVEDLDGTISRTDRLATAASSDVRVGIALPPGILRVGERIFLEIVVVTPADVPVADHRLSVVAVQPFVQGPPAAPGSSQTEIVERFCTGRTDTGGVLRCTFEPRRPGPLRFVATTEDAHGREARAVLPLRVAGAGSTDRIEILADRARYQPGDQAGFFVTPPFTPALVLLTLERERLLWYRVQPFDDPAPLDIEVDARWAPGAQLVATALGPWPPPAAAMSSGAYVEGELPLVIALPDESSLVVRMDLDRSVVAPGDAVRARIRTQDPAGRPVRADVNVFAVEETTLELTGHSVPDLPVSFHPLQPSGVAHLDSRRFTAMPASSTIAASGASAPSRSDAAGENTRRWGVPHGAEPLVTWAGSLSTGDRGEVAHTFPAPTSYGRYRVLAVAVAETAAGAAETSFAVDAPLGIEGMMPAFVRPGDQVAVGVRLWNTEAEARELTATMETADERLFTFPSDVRTLRLEPGPSLVARWPMAVRDTAAGEGRVVFTARSSKHRRRLELPVVVERAAPRSFLRAAGAVEPGGRAVLDLGIPPGSPPTGVAVNVSTTGLVAIPLLLEELAAYPHDTLASRTMRVLGLLAACAPGKERSPPAPPCERTEVLLQPWRIALPRYRCPDGSYGEHPGCALGSDAALTTLVLEILREAGVQGAATTELSDRRRDAGDLPAADLGTAAQTLRALASAAPGDPRTVELARALIAQAAARPVRSPGDLGRVIQALGAAAGFPAAGTTAAITVNGKPLVSDRVVGKGVETLEVGLPFEPPSTAPKLEIANTGAGLLFYAVRQPLAYPAALASRPPQGLQIRRSYVDRAGKPARSPWRLGDVIRVVLSLHTTEPIAELVVEDPLAAGLEPIVLDSLRLPGAVVYAQARRDHVEFHMRLLEKPRKRLFELTYLMRAVVPGTFRAPGPRAEHRDRPEIGVVGDDAVITIAGDAGP